MGLRHSLDTFLAGFRVPMGAAAGRVLTCADANGTAVWAAAAAASTAVPTEIAASETYAIASRTQALFRRPIRIDGRLRVDAGGALVSVS